MELELYLRCLNGIRADRFLGESDKRQSFGFEIRWPDWVRSFRYAGMAVVRLGLGLNQIDRLGRKLSQSQMFKNIRRRCYFVALRHFILCPNEIVWINIGMGSRYR
jgi:hypothetical protein